MAQPISTSSPAPTVLAAAPPPRGSAPEKSFSIAPAIFVPFASLPKDSAPSDPVQRLELILRNLEKQHDAVRRNMVSLLEQRSRDLVACAKEELGRLEQEAGEGEDWMGELERIGEEEVKGMMRRVRAKREPGRDAKEYEVKREDFQLWEDEIQRVGETTATAVGGRDGNGDVQMGGTEAPQPLNEAQVRRQLTQKLMDLVNAGVLEMEQYYLHTMQTMKVYRDALDRRRGKGRTGSGPAPPGILKNRDGAGEMRRMSTGMPLAGTMPLAHQAVRTFENYEELARRDSR